MILDGFNQNNKGTSTSAYNYFSVVSNNWPQADWLETQTNFSPKDKSKIKSQGSINYYGYSGTSFTVTDDTKSISVEVVLKIKSTGKVVQSWKHTINFKN